MTDSAMIFRFSSADAAGLCALAGMRLTRPWNDPVKDIHASRPTRTSLWCVPGDEVIASVMIGYDGHRGTINYLAIAPAFQRSGLGAELMRRQRHF